MEGNINDNKGRLRQKWIDNKKRWTNIEGYDGIIRGAQDREKWRIMTDEPSSRRQHMMMMIKHRSVY